MMRKDRLDQLLSLKKLQPDDPFLSYAICLEMKKLGQIDEAIDGLVNLIKSHPSYLASYYQLGKSWEELNEWEKATSTYQKGIGIAESQKEMHTLMELKRALEDISSDDL